MTLVKMKREKKSCRASSRSRTAGVDPVEKGTNVSVTFRELNIQDSFDIVKTLAEGCFARIILVKRGKEKLVLKAIHCELSSAEDFNREMNINYFLSPHQNIVTSFNVSFLWNNCFVYVQEHAPCGDLSKYVKKGGLPESQVKLVIQQLASAVEFMHSVRLVHRDLKLENILVFKPNLSCIKLCDFGYTRMEGTLVTKTNQTWMQFAPPEICQVVHLERYYCNSSSDVWQVGVILCVCLTGLSPWQCADITDPAYRQYVDWHRRKSLRMPERFKPFSPRLIRLLKRLLEPKSTKRSSITEVTKYLKDDWIRKGWSASTASSVSSSNSHGALASERRESTSTNAYQGQKIKLPEESRGSVRSRTGVNLKKFGLEASVDKRLITDRVVDWITSSSSSGSGSV